MTTTLITRRCTMLFAAGVLAAGALAPVASAVVGPSTPVQEPPVQDLRSPDARDSAAGYAPVATEAPATPRDLRSPDARDAATGYAPEPVPVPVSVSTDGGFDWVSAAIGAAAIGGLILLLLAFMGPRRHVGSGSGGRGRRHVLHT